ncbi:hypothetical protein MMC19_001000 [Ptychographa xylographoides]|nr:hypothetical protein [Ptychographa xylographoides]
MPLELSPIRKSDTETTVNLRYDAYADDPISHHIHPVPASTSLRQETVKCALRAWGTSSVERSMGVRDTETGDIIAESKWVVIPQRTGSDSDGAPTALDVPSGWNKEVLTQIRAQHTKVRNDIMGPRPHVFLTQLVVAPAYQRRGVGGMLLTWVTQQAKDLNLPVFLTASPSGQQLYAKHGFSVVGTARHDFICEAPAMLLAAPFPDAPPSSIPPSVPDPELPDAPIAALPQEGPAAAATTSALSYDVRIEPVTDDADFYRLSEIEFAAFADDKLIALAFPPYPPPDPASRVAAAPLDPTIALRDHAQRHADSRHQDPSNRYWKATSVTTGEIVGWTKWHFFDDLSRTHTPFPDGWPPYSNHALLEATFGKLRTARESRMQGQQYAFVLVLVTHPEWHRRGVGRKLLVEGLRTADTEGWDTWLDASPNGEGLYLKLGWEEVGSVSIDLGEFGGEKGYVERTKSMIRKAGWGAG